MTRYARAKGSKASNERVPEEASSWSEMKRQLLEKNKKVEETKKKQEVDRQKKKNYEAFLKVTEEEQSKNVKWAEFPSEKIKKTKKVEKNNNTTLGEKMKKKKKPLKRKSEQDPNVDTPVMKLSTENQPAVPNSGKLKKHKSDKKKFEKNSNTTLGQKIKKKKKPLKSEQDSNVDAPVRKIPTENQEERPNTETVREQKNGKKKFEKTTATVIKTKIQKKLQDKKQNRKNFKKSNVQKPKKPVDPATLSEEDRKKLEKKKEKRLRQLEKKKLQKPSPKKMKERRKSRVEKFFINGKEISIAYVDGFPVKKEDADRLQELRKQMISKGLPRSEIAVAMKLERRKAEKALAREKKKVCFNCRMSGHNLSECPNLDNQMAQTAGTGICFKCGSTEHTHFECKVVKGEEFKYAQCFICHEQGHIARQCPDNARGLYPKGGACKVCGDVTHLKKDCPTYQEQQRQAEQSIHAETMREDDNPDSLGQNEEPIGIKEQKRPNKIVKFK